MTPKAAILIVDDEEKFRRLIGAEFSRKGYAVHLAHDAREAWGVLTTHRVDVMILDIVLPGEDGVSLLKRARRLNPATQAIMLTGNGTMATAIESMKQGAYDYLAKPINFAQLCMVVERACAEVLMRRENELLRRELDRRDRFEEFVGRHRSIEAIKEVVRRVAATDSPVLVCGETGTGKELIARMVHAQSPRRGGRFLAINCAALQETLLESELFGHEKGAFTDAGHLKPGLIESSDGGTLFLDEIGSMAASTQAKILRLLDSGEYRRVGGVEDLKNGGRVVSASNQDLPKAIKDGVFREDLFYRINVVTIHAPPLRERGQDIPLLVEHFLAKFHALQTHGRKEMSPQAMEMLQSYHWPGNVRELQNVVERAVIMAEGSMIEPDALWLPGFNRGKPQPARDATLAEVERAHILAVLADTGGNRTKAAAVLGVDVKTIYNKLKERDSPS